MLVTSSYQYLLLAGVPLTAAAGGILDNAQRVLGWPQQSPSPQQQHAPDAAVLRCLELHKDPVDAMTCVQPELKDDLSQPRLLRVGSETEAQWMTEGDKMRLRRRGVHFVDVTDYDEFYSQMAVAQKDQKPQKPHLPGIHHQHLVKPLFPKVSTQRMHDAVEKMTSFYNRAYFSTHGEMSAQWLHDRIADIIKKAPFHTHISLEVFPHTFPQPSIIARFEPKVRNFSLPLTVLGAHQDSMNYLFPLLPAPGADDDCSGSISNLEAFQVLAESGFIPLNGPVEFHWYAAEEAGLLGSQAVARYKKDSGATIGAMIEFDMTAFVGRKVNETIGIIRTGSTGPLVEWALKLAREYSSIGSDVYDLFPGAGSDYTSFTNLGYPAVFASEGNPYEAFDPYVHTVKDRMDVDDETGVFSFEHMARFAEFAIAFVVEQAGWDNKWR